MLYPAYVRKALKGPHAATLPDFPGVTCTADALPDLSVAIQQAIEAHYAGVEMEILSPTPLDRLHNHPDYTGGVWLLVDIDVDKLHRRPVNLTITLPAHLAASINQYATSHQMSRSDFLAKAATKAMQANTTQRIKRRPPRRDGDDVTAVSA